MITQEQAKALVSEWYGRIDILNAVMRPQDEVDAEITRIADELLELIRAAQKESKGR